MAQDEQESLIEWLKTNNLNFLKDALVEESFTLEMIIDMRDKDIDDMFDELKISNLKRIRFRTAVKHLKEKKIRQTQKNYGPAKVENKRNSSRNNINTNKHKNGKDESNASDINNKTSMDSKVIKNGLVLNICISKYGKQGFEDLEGPTNDMTKLIDLWANRFGYSIICNDYDPKVRGYYVSKEDFLQKLDECRLELRSNKNDYDGLIFVFSGHGYKTSIVTSDSLYVEIDKIKRHFSSKEISKLKDKPKIYIFDCCRSITRDACPITDDSRLMMMKMRGNNNSGVNANSNLEYYHPFINTIEIYGNTQGYAVGDGKSGGSLIGLITQHLSNYAINDSKNNILSEKTFEELLYPVERALHNLQYGTQTMEIVKRSLGYKLYLLINDKRNVGGKIDCNYNYDSVDDARVRNDNDNNKDNSDETTTKEEKEETEGVVSSQPKCQAAADQAQKSLNPIKCVTNQVSLEIAMNVTELHNYLQKYDGKPRYSELNEELPDVVIDEMQHANNNKVNHESKVEETGGSATMGSGPNMYTTGRNKGDGDEKQEMKECDNGNSNSNNDITNNSGKSPTTNLPGIESSRMRKCSNVVTRDEWSAGKTIRMDDLAPAFLSNKNGAREKKNQSKNESDRDGNNNNNNNNVCDASGYLSLRDAASYLTLAQIAASELMRQADPSSRQYWEPMDTKLPKGLFGYKFLHGVKNYHHFMSKAILHHEPQFIYDAICDPTFRFHHDKMLESIQVVEKLDDSTSVQRMIHLSKQYFVETRRETVVVVGHRVVRPGDKYVIAGKSVDHPRYPTDSSYNGSGVGGDDYMDENKRKQNEKFKPSGIVRIDLKSSGWVIERNVKKPNDSIVSYITNVNFGGLIPSAICKNVAQKQQLSVYYLGKVLRRRHQKLRRKSRQRHRPGNTPFNTLGNASNNVLIWSFF